MELSSLRNTNVVQNRVGDKQLYLRLVAVWVVCEGFLGGILHGIRLPVSGLIVASCAVICICFIAFHFPKKGSVLKATVIVLIFKMMLSPHTPPAAYFAVFFQGFCGELLFVNRKFFKVSCVLLGIIALVESALQGILMLVILYGNTLWTAVNIFINKITKQTNDVNYSLIFASVYVLIYGLVGMLAGLFTIRLLYRNEAVAEMPLKRVQADSSQTSSVSRRKFKGMRMFFLFLWIAFLLLYVQSISGFGEPLLPSHSVVQLLFRSLFIFLTWYFILSPLLTRVIKKWLKGKQLQWKDDVEQILLLIPATKNLFISSWQLSSQRRGIGRIALCFRLIMTQTLYNVEQT